MNILIYDNGQPFGFNTPYEKPLGGSETSILLLSKGLEELGHSCVILNSGKETETLGHRKIDTNLLFSQYANIADVIVLNRSVPRDIYDFSNKDIYFYSHDAFDQEMIGWMGRCIETENERKATWTIFKKILVVSEWQKQTFNKYYNVPLDKMEVVPNPLDSSLYYGYQERDKNRLIYASIPYKGISFLKDIFNELLIKTKNDKLNLHIYSNMELYGQDNKEYESIFHELSIIKNVFIHDVVSMKELAYEFMK